MPEVLREWFEAAAALNWHSHDPFDLLLSPATGWVRRACPFVARVIIRFGRHSGAGLRRLLGVPKHEEAHGLANFLTAAAMLAQDGVGWARGYVSPLVTRLLQRGIPAGDGVGWGLEFPYATRFVSVAARTPSLYTTVVALNALFAAVEIEESQTAIEAVHRGVAFVLKALGRFEQAGRWWFRYWAGCDAKFVNVQALYGSLLLRLAARGFIPEQAAAGMHALETVQAAQAEDGSWPYAMEPNGRFVDGFHTGFILQSLAEVLAEAPRFAPAGLKRTMERGYAFFCTNLLSPEGLPRAYAGSGVNLVGQNAAQCIQTLLMAPSGKPDLPKASSLFWRLVVRVQTRQIRPGWRRLLPGPHYPQLRWTLSPLALAGAHLHRAQQPAAQAGAP